MQWKILVGCNIVRRSATGDLWGLGMKTMIRIWYPVVNLCFLFLFFPSFPFCVWVSNKMPNYRRVLTFPRNNNFTCRRAVLIFLTIGRGKKWTNDLKKLHCSFKALTKGLLLQSHSSAQLQSIGDKVTAKTDMTPNTDHSCASVSSGGTTWVILNYFPRHWSLNTLPPPSGHGAITNDLGGDISAVAQLNGRIK